MQLAGFHHLTAVTADVVQNHAFYTRTLGLRLVKKSVNQDDVSAYHLFYADGEGAPGTDITFFDWPVPRERRGTGSVVRTGLRVASEASLRWWADHLSRAGVAVATGRDHVGRDRIEFEDFEGQRLLLGVDDGHGPAHPWSQSPVPTEHQIRGLGPVTLSVPELGPTERVLTRVMNMHRENEYKDACRAGVPVHVFRMAGGGPASELHVVVEPKLPPVRPGAGGVHHVAFRTTAAEYGAWTDRLREQSVLSSGPVDRYYFRSLYFRVPGGILFEIATDEPGFAADEPLDALGTRLALPPFLEARRAEIEAGLKPLEA